MSQQQSPSLINGGTPNATLNRMILEGRSFSSHERNNCYLNTGSSPQANGRFANISAVSGLDFPDDGRAVATVDWDQDGDLDLWITNRSAPRLRLMRNDLPRTNHFIALRLQGNGITTNRDAIGARIELILDGTENSKPMIQTLRAGEGFLAQSSKWIHFGLGDTDTIKMVTVRWPGGEIEEFGSVSSNQRYLLTQGSGTAKKITSPPRNTSLKPSPQTLPEPTLVARIPIVELHKTPPFSYQEVDGIQKTITAKPDRALLINLWASWCPPCEAELKEFAKRYKELNSAGIDVIALSVDGLDPTQSTKQDADNMMAEQKFPFTTGHATPQLISDLQELHDLHLPLHRTLPLPSSFLIDRKGRLAVIYTGPVSVDTILQDAKLKDGKRLDKFAQSAPFKGTNIDHPRIEETASNAAWSLRMLLAQYLKATGRTQEAEKHFSEILKIYPDNPVVLHNIGAILVQSGKPAEGVEYLNRAIEIRPDFAEVYNSLAIALHTQGKIDDAIKQFRQAIKLNPNYADAHSNLGSVLARLFETYAAIEHFHQALRIDPDYTAAKRNLSLAVQELRASILQKPAEQNLDLTSAHFELGKALRKRRDIPKATQHYQWALNLNPNHVPSLHQLAWLLTIHPNPEIRNTNRAIKLAQKACQLTDEKSPAPLAILAAIYAETNRFGDATNLQTKAIELSQPTEKETLRKYLKLYQLKKSSREITPGILEALEKPPKKKIRISDEEYNAP